MHFDLTEAEAQMRAQLAESVKASDAMIADGTGDANFIRAQRYYDEARVQFALAYLRSQNEGVDRNEMLAGASLALGTAFATLLGSCVGNRERDMVAHWFDRALSLTIGGETQKGAYSARTAIIPEEGGNA